MPQTPPAGFHSITPRLILRAARDAIAFCKEAFGAEKIFRLEAGDLIAPAEMQRRMAAM